MRFLLVSLMLALSAQASFAADAVEPAAAASQSVSVAASAPTPEAEAPKVVCHQESDIGSMRMHKVCTKVQTDAELRQTQDALRNALPNSGLAHQAPGLSH